MAPDRPPRAETGTIAGVLANLRRAPKRVRRQSREVIENAVSQLFDAAVRYPHGALGSGEYRIEDLARLAGTTTRNIRVYRDRGLLPPPLRVGRIALFNDTHLTRLRLITSMLDRGYNIAHVREMLSAWEEGKDLGDVLGLETAIVGTWTSREIPDHAGGRRASTDQRPQGFRPLGAASGDSPRRRTGHHHPPGTDRGLQRDPRLRHGPGNRRSTCTRTSSR